MDKMDIAEQAFKTGFKAGVTALALELVSQWFADFDDDMYDRLSANINDAQCRLLHPQGEDGKVMKWRKFER